MISNGAEGDIIIEFVQLGGDGGVHFEPASSRVLTRVAGVRLGCYLGIIRSCSSFGLNIVEASRPFQGRREVTSFLEDKVGRELELPL